MKRGEQSANLPITRLSKQLAGEAPLSPNEGDGSTGWAHLKKFAVALERCTGIFGPLKTVVNELVTSVETYEASNVANGRSEFRELRIELEALFQELHQHYSGEVPPAATVSIENLCGSILKELAYLKEKQDRGTAREIIEAGEDADRILMCYRRIQRHLHRLTLNADLSMWKITDELATNARLDRLAPVFSACYKSSQAAELKRGECTPGTRLEVIAQLHNWVHSSAAGSVYWLNGMAGTGKTTIAYSWCAELELARRLGASFFCSRSLPECRDVNRIVPSIAYQLAQFSRPFRYELSRVLEVERDVHTQLLRIQFEKLIVEPIEQVRATLPEDIVVVIDALDECDSRKSARQILETLLTRTTDLPIKFFIASRPEPEIREQMKKRAGRKAVSRLVLHELDKAIVQGDIETYLRAALQQITPSESEIRALTERAGILFIYAATVVRYIGHSEFTKNPRKRLKNVLEVSSAGGNNPYKEIDELYTLVLAAAFDDPESDADERADTKNVLYTALCAHEPLTTSALSGLLGLHDMDRVHAALAPLWSVLHVVELNGLVTTLHASFPDYMFDPARSKQYHCDPVAHDHVLAHHCFDCLRDTKPQFNICGLESSCITDDKIQDLETRIRATTATEVLYACRYWEEHLQRAKGSSDVCDRLASFLANQLLLWMEIANINKYMVKGVEMLARTAVWCSRKSCPEDLKQMAHEAWRFAAAFASTPVSQSTPHIYMSMLPFWPASSLISRNYAKHMQRMIRAQGTAMSRRSQSLLAVWSMNGSITSLCWSPDSTRIAFICDGHIYVRNSVTGKSILGPLNQTSLLGPLGITANAITSIGYSPCDARIASGSRNGTLCVWDSEGGKKLHGPMKGHTKEVRSVSFSLDGKQIVSGSKDCTVWIWDAHDGKKLLGPLKGHSDWVTSVAFSPNCTLVASGSNDRTLRIWDARTGQAALSPLKGHTGSVNSVAFSPDGTRITSGSSDWTIRVWSVEKGHSVSSPFEGHADSVYSVSFSPDGSRIVSGSSDKTIRTWDAHTGRSILSPFEGHAGSVCSVAFSPDGSRIASASEDESVRTWDARTEQPKLSPPEGHVGWVLSVSSSPDGTRIVSGSDDNTIRMWDVQTGQPTLSPLEGHTGSVNSVAFSPDGTCIVSGSDDKTIRMWDAQTGQPMLGPLEGHTDSVWSVAFSPVGTHIVSGSSDMTIRIWDAQTGQPMLGPLEGHADRVSSVAFSPDGIRIVSGSWDKTILIWDAQTGHAMLSLHTGYTGSVVSVAFSRDGTRIVSGGGDTTIRMWSAQTGRLRLSPLKGHTGSVSSVAFSPDGTRIVSGSSDNTIQIWDAQTGQPMLSLEGHTFIRSVTFLPDGTRIVSSSEDNSIQMWDVRTGVSMASSTLPICFSVQFLTFHITLYPQPAGSVLASPFSWEIRADGWVVDSDDNSNLLVWVPSDLQPLLLSPRQTFIMSTDTYVRLDFDDACVGTSWIECYQPCV